MNIKIAYNKKFKSFNILEEKIIDILNPNKGQVIKNKFLLKALDSVIEKPIGGESLSNLLRKDSKIVIIIDDNTRPTPSKKILESIISLFKKKNIPSDNINIIIAVGAHKKLNKKEIIEIVGEDIYNDYKIDNHDALNSKDLIYLGHTSFGTPVIINKKVYEADLRILTGVIKPHNIAGYTGGGKSILPGVCGIDTILSNHSFIATSHQNSRLGLIGGNPMREDIEEVLNLIGTSFLINVVLNYKEEIVEIVSGDAIKAHRTGANSLDKLSKLNVSRKADICICGTPAPIDINFYQMLNSISAPYRLKNPIIKPGGTIIVIGTARQGISDGDFYSILKSISREEIWKQIKLKESIYKERPALHIYLEGEKNYNLIVVSEKSNRKLFEDMKINFSTNLQNTVDEVLDNYKGDNNTIVLPYAPYVIPNLINLE